MAVLTDQVSNHARLTGLDAATGAVRWSLRFDPPTPATDPPGGILVRPADLAYACALTG